MSRATRQNPIFLAPWLYYLGLTVIVGGTAYAGYRVVKEHYDRKREQAEQQAKDDLKKAAGWGGLAVVGIAAAVLALKGGGEPARYGGAA